VVTLAPTGMATAGRCATHLVDLSAPAREAA